MLHSVRPLKNNLRLYGRLWCHLCEDMRQALLPLQAEFGFDLEMLDVDTDACLQQRYGERIPVLTAVEKQEEVELCHYRLDVSRLRQYLGGTGPMAD